MLITVAMEINPLELFGREIEQRQLEEALSQVNARGSALLIRGVGEAVECRRNVAEERRRHASMHISFE